ncbi:hypothetical protein [methane-oxidizing endosymbiont of Gigantopelta aegis]|nr:hypothetical protein [methane-oxidizing endosymbiont of Gigantopelta aegis]
MIDKDNGLKRAVKYGEYYEYDGSDFKPFQADADQKYNGFVGKQTH